MHSNTMPDTIITTASFAKSSLRRRTDSVSFRPSTIFPSQVPELLVSCLCLLTLCIVSAESVSASDAPVSGGAAAGTVCTSDRGRRGRLRAHLAMRRR